MSPSLLRPSRAWNKLTHAQAQPMVSHPESVSADRNREQTQTGTLSESQPNPMAPAGVGAPRPPVPGSVPAPVPQANKPAVSIPSRPHHHRSRSRYGGTGRSHHGGATSSSSYAHMNEFPVFSGTGDVEVVIRASGQERRYLLHRLILSQCSGFFEAGMSEEWGTRSRVGDDGLSIVNEDESGSGLRRTTSRATAKTRWRYELDWEDKEEDELPILVQKTPTANNSTFTGEMSSRPPTVNRNKPATPQQGFFRTMANLTGIQSALHLPGTATAPEQPVDPTIRDYDNLFRIFYNYAPKLNSVNIATAYAECKSLLTLADMYDALPVTGPRVDHHLLRFSSRLYKQIAKYPPSYLKLGYLARSKVIFSDALIHVVGQWPAALPHLGPNSYSPLPDHVLDLIEDKVDDLDDAIARIESKLFRLTLTTSRGERVSPSNAYLDWLAVSLFRQWLVENTTPPPASILKSSPTQATTTTVPSAANQSRHLSTSAPSRPTSRPTSGSGTRTTPKHSPPTPPFSIGRTYRLLGSPSPQSYLPHEDLKRFLKLQPSLYTRENMKRFERKVDEMKRLARELVKPVMRNFLELDLRALAGTMNGEGEVDMGMLLPYLTCTRVGEGDFPWEY